VRSAAAGREALGARVEPWGGRREAGAGAPGEATMRRAAAVLLLLFAACEPCREPDGWEVTGDTIPEGVGVAIQAALEASPCAPLGWGGNIEFQLLPFIYGPNEMLVEGLVEDVECCPRVRVATFGRPVEETPLAHELGHVLWIRCGKVTYDAARCCHPRDFLEWTWAVDARIAERLGHPALPAFEAPAWACPE